MFNTLAICLSPKLILSFLLVAVIPYNKIIGQTAGPSSPGTASNIGVTKPWSNLTNVILSNNTYASVSVNSGQVSDVLIVTNFGFTIPTSATIDGVAVEIEKYGSRTVFFIPIRYIRDNTISLTTDGTIPTGDNKATATSWSSMKKPAP